MTTQQLNEPITEDWLKSVGFKWHQFDRQPNRQWLLWLGEACADSTTSYEDLGIELAHCGYPDRSWWFCWLRSDGSHRYSRFLHVRHIQFQREVIAMIEGLTGAGWDVSNNINGLMMAPKHAASIRADWERLDLKIMREGHPWRDIEKDDSRGGALPEHMQHAIDAGKAK